MKKKINEKRVVFRKFESVTELSEFIKNTPQTKEGKKYSSSLRGSKSFCGTENFGEAENLLLYGDSENAENVRKNIEQITAALKGKNKSFNGAKTLSYTLKSSAVGFLPIVPKCLAGEPENMFTLHKVQKQTTKVLNVLVYLGALCDVTAEELNMCLCRILCAVFAMEKEGFRVNLFAVATASFRRGKDGVFGYSVKIKDSGQKIDLLKIAYSLCNPSSLRRHGFAVFERLDGSNLKVKLGFGYGGTESHEDAKETLAKQGFKNFALVGYYTCKDKNVGEITDFIKSQF